MLNICGNFVPILITILCCAGLFMYFNLRVAEIKVAVEKQNRVLTAFITNVQQDIRSGGGAGVMPVPFGVGMNHMAAPEALIAAQKFGNDKIVVSDDEESDEESDDESDEESDEETDDETNDECDEATKPVVVSVINLQEMNFENSPHAPTPIPISFEDLSSHDKIDGENEKASESTITEIIDVSAGLVDTGLVDTTTASYEQMKVDDLRKLATDKNLASKEEIKKMKKPELLILLKK